MTPTNTIALKSAKTYTLVSLGKIKFKCLHYLAGHLDTIYFSRLSEHQALRYAS